MTQHHHIIIIGAGFAGLGLAIQLKKSGFNDFVILEREAGVGGTWWVNRYPGAACDVQSHLYSLSFAPKADWTRQFAPRQEIQTHLEDLIAAFDLAPHLKLNTEITKAQWDEHTKQWHLTDGNHQHRSAQVLVGALGGLARPAWPDIDGLEAFNGRIIHSQQWPNDLDLTDQRIGVIGTGASAVQFVPHLAKKARSLSVFQRTPNWILPKPDRPIGPILQKLYRFFPPARHLTRLGLFLLLETRLPAFTRWPALSALHRRKALKHLKQQVDDPTLVKALTPRYAMGCKRVLMSNDYYPTFNLPHVKLIDQTIAHVTPTGIVDEKGNTYPVDVIVLGTGFQATSPIPQGLIVGKDQIDLGALWANGPKAYKGTAVHGFPNFFMLLGPNTALGHNSVLLMIEGQIRYIIQALKEMKKNHWQQVEITAQAQTNWNERLDRTLSQSVWNAGGCQSWYLHPVSGRNTTLWPHTTIRFKSLTKRFDHGVYACK